MHEAGTGATKVASPVIVRTTCRDVDNRPRLIAASAYLFGLSILCRLVPPTITEHVIHSYKWHALVLPYRAPAPVRVYIQDSE